MKLDIRYMTASPNNGLHKITNNINKKKADTVIMLDMITPYFSSGYTRETNGRSSLSLSRLIVGFLLFFCFPPSSSFICVVSLLRVCNLEERNKKQMLLLLFCAVICELRLVFCGGQHIIPSSRSKGRKEKKQKKINKQEEKLVFVCLSI